MLFKQYNQTGPKYLLGCQLFEQILNSFGKFQLGFSIVILKEAKEWNIYVGRMSSFLFVPFYG